MHNAGRESARRFRFFALSRNGLRHLCRCDRRSLSGAVRFGVRLQPHCFGTQAPKLSDSLVRDPVLVNRLVAFAERVAWCA
jgi:hypothetical protein